MKEELSRCERKLQDAHLDARQRANAERESVRAEVRREIDTLNNKVGTEESLLNSLYESSV